jgi:hypothetical protein
MSKAWCSNGGKIELHTLPKQSQLQELEHSIKVGVPNWNNMIP